METGTKLIRGTAIISESHRFTVHEKTAFANVLQATELRPAAWICCLCLQALDYGGDNAYAWTLQNIHQHPEPFQAQPHPKFMRALPRACRYHLGQREGP